MRDIIPGEELPERAVLGSIVMRSDPQFVLGLTTRGLRPEHFYWQHHGRLFTAAVSLAERQLPSDPITLHAEVERLQLGDWPSSDIDALAGYVPAAGHYGEYADRIIDLARWRRKVEGAHRAVEAAVQRDGAAFEAALQTLDMSHMAGRVDSYGPAQLADILLDYFMASDEVAARFPVPCPFPKLNDAMGGGLRPGESCVLGGHTNHGKSIVADQWADCAAEAGKSVHLYLTEMTALDRAMRMIARRTGVPYMDMRRRGKSLSDRHRKMILDELGSIPYGLSIVADWQIDDVVRHALRGRFDFPVIDLIHGFHYRDERELDRFSKALQRLARVSTLTPGFNGSAVLALGHLKDEGLRDGVPSRPTLASLKGASSIRQDVDIVMFVHREYDADTLKMTGEAEVYVDKGRGSEMDSEGVRLNPRRFRFEVPSRDYDEGGIVSGASVGSGAAAF